MRKITTIALFLAFSWQINAQNFDFANAKKNELKLDAAWILVPALKIEYEHFLNDWSSVGAVGFMNFEPDEVASQLLGLYRLYFGKDPMKGFFLEGHAGLTFGERWKSGRYRNFTAFGVGVALGWKYHIPKSDIVLDLFLGFGRTMPVTTENGSSQGYYKESYSIFYPRVGVCVGKRF